MSLKEGAENKKDTNQSHDNHLPWAAWASAAQERKDTGQVQRYFCVSFGKTLLDLVCPQYTRTL